MTTMTNTSQRPQKTSPRGMSGLVRILQPVESANRWLDGFLLDFDQITGLHRFLVGVNTAFSEATWTCIFTPMSMWFRLVTNVLVGLFLYHTFDPIQRKRDAASSARWDRERSGQVKWTSLADLQRVLREAFKAARQANRDEAMAKLPPSPAPAEKRVSEEEMDRAFADYLEKRKNSLRK